MTKKTKTTKPKSDKQPVVIKRAVCRDPVTQRKLHLP